MKATRQTRGGGKTKIGRGVDQEEILGGEGKQRATFGNPPPQKQVHNTRGPNLVLKCEGR